MLLNGVLIYMFVWGLLIIVDKFVIVWNYNFNGNMEFIVCCNNV